MPDRHQYTVGWICAIRVELVAAKLFLDERHDKIEEIPLEDSNVYALGKIGSHNVVVASLPDGEYGSQVAGTVARDLLRSFPNIKIGLMVGIGGGVPSAKHDIRLGDVVVSTTSNGEPGVFQYDFGKTIQNGEFQHTRFLDQTPRLLRSAVADVRSEYDIVGHQLQSNIDAILEKNRKVRKTHQRPPKVTDRLYVSDFVHQPDTDAACEESCGNDESICIPRPPREEDEDDPTVHYGLIASGNTLIKDAQVRDRLALSKDVLCFEMEAAGLMNHFPCLVIRGICDYADSHKKKSWQGYAAMTAAAYAKDILNCIPARQVHLETPIADALDALGKDMNEILDGTYERDRVNILDWITSKDYGPEHSDRLEQREKGTGQWFLDSKEFKAWIKDDNETLFCPGIPGAGKTILASIVIDHIGSHLHNSSDASLGYIYFDHKQKEQHGTNALIASLLKQLAASRSVVPDTVRKLYDTHRQQRTRPSLDEMTRCLQAVVEARSKVYIVVDALDECTDGSDDCQSRPLHEFLNIIFQLQTTHVVNILATSRYIPDISQRFEGALLQEIRASPDDIRAYVSTQVQQMGGKIQGDDELQETIKETILDAVDGMFLMARLYIQSLRACMMTKRKVKEALERFSRQEYASDTNRTHRAYDEAVIRIDSQNKEYQMIARHALLWITYTERPLTADELTHALAVEQGKPTFDEDNMPSIEDVVSVCAGLVALDDASGIVRLVHHTAYEYFRDTRSDWFPETESAISSSCVTYLSYKIFASEKHEPEYVPGSEWPTILKFTEPADPKDSHIDSHCLYRYAATYWGHHARRVGAAAVDARMIKFLDSTPLTKSSWGAMPANDDPWLSFRTRAVTGIHMASYFGIEEAVRQLLVKGTNINQGDGKGWTPLCYAAYSGHEPVIRLLLEHNSQTFCSRESKSRALYLALKYGHEEVALRLLRKGADIDGDERQPRFVYEAAANGLDEALERLSSLGADLNSAQMDGSADLHVDARHGYTALQVAAAHGQETTVKMLLKRGLQINTSHDWLGTALNQAAEAGQTKVVAMLLNYGANYEIGYSCGGTPLVSAAAKGHLETVRLLIDRGADINAVSEGRERGTPLFWATSRGHAKICQLLLDRGAKIDHPNLEGYTPLCWVAREQHNDILRLLLDWGADIDATNCKGNSALHEATENAREANVRLLLERGANIQATNNNGDSPLHQAARSMSEANLKLLLDLGADVQATNNYGDSPLHEAAQEGNVAHMELLIECGARIEAANNWDSTTLHTAVFFGSRRAVRLLLNQGANANAVDRSYRTPLCWACHHNRLWFVKRLLKSDADVNATDGWGNTPLLCAVSGLSTKNGPLLYADGESIRNRCHWSMKVIQLLIDSGANVSAKNLLGNTALHVAADAGYERAVLSLIQLGADVNARNNRGETALYAVGVKRPKVLERLSVLWRRNRGAWGSLPSHLLSFESRATLLCSNPRIAYESGEAFDDNSEMRRRRWSWNSQTNVSSTCDSVDSFPDSSLFFYCQRRSSETNYGMPGTFSPFPPVRQNAEVFYQLLAKGASTETVDNNGLTLLWSLASAGDAKFVRQLLHHGANTEATDSCRRTALHMSASKGHFYVAELLLTYKAAIEAADDNGRTPLWAAAWSGETGIVQLLLDRGARLKVVDICGRTPLQVAVMRGHDDVESILSERGARDEDCFGFQRLFCERGDASPHHSTSSS